jgi:hypothetical protein
VLPFDQDAAEVYGPLRAQLERIGVRLDEPSLRIAAIALSRDLTLVTASARLYDRVPGLRIENWLEPDEVGLELDETELERQKTEAAAVPGTTDGGNGTRHPGLVPSLDARARAAAGGAAEDEEDEAS